MHDEQVQEPHLVVPKLGQLAHDGVGNEVGAAGAGGEGELLLEPGHVVVYARVPGVIRFVEQSAEDEEGKGHKDERKVEECCWVG